MSIPVKKRRDIAADIVLNQSLRPGVLKALHIQHLGQTHGRMYGTSVSAKGFVHSMSEGLQFQLQWPLSDCLPHLALKDDILPLAVLADVLDVLNRRKSLHVCRP